MADILHDLSINAAPAVVYDSVSTPAGLDAWWTLWSTGEPAEGADFVLGFGPEFHWRASVTGYEPDRLFELTMTEAESDWLGTRVRFELDPAGDATRLRFSHSGWREASEHFRQSSFCWAMYLNVLRRHLEAGMPTPYADRDSG